MYNNKTPGNDSRKTISKKKQANLDRVAGTNSSRPSSRAGSRVGSRANSDNEDSDYENNDAQDFDDDDDHHHRVHAEVTWESQLKDTIEELYEKRSR